MARKATEIVDALALERVMGKDEILTAYLNIALLVEIIKGKNIAGAQQAAEGIFGVEALNEAAHENEGFIPTVTRHGT